MRVGQLHDKSVAGILRCLKSRLLIVFALVALFGIGFVTFTSLRHRYRRPELVASYVRAIGGEAGGIEPTGPIWLQEWLAKFNQPSFTSLKFVMLQNLPAVSDDEFAYIAQARDIEILIVYGTSITESGFGSLKQLKKLKELKLSGHQVTDDVLTYISHATNLTQLYTWNTRISDKGLPFIESYRNMQNLVLGHSQVSDRGLHHLASLAKLEYLELSGTQISDSGLVHLRSLTNLKQLDLTDTKVTSRGVAELRDFLPDTFISGP